MSLTVQRAVEVDDTRIYPGVWPAFVRLGAGFDDAGEGGIETHPVGILADPALQTLRNVEGIERQDAPEVGIDKEEARVIARIGHRKDAPPIAGKQVLGRKTRWHIRDMVRARGGVNNHMTDRAGGAS